MWEFKGRSRPPFAIEPGPGQESVWDYPRPPILVPDDRRVVVTLDSGAIAESNRCFRVLETASPPAFYIPPEDIDAETLRRAAGASFCEWKGVAQYWASANAQTGAGAIGWSYSRPTAAFAKIAGYFSFYPGRVECRVDGERVRPQPGDFYGGWITNDVVGPFKGDPGTGHW